MANRTLFRSFLGKLIPRTDSTNEAGGRAYQLSSKAALAQYAATGCLNGTYYASAGEQLDRVVSLAGELEPEFVAKTAIYARERAFMKDMPALLLERVGATVADEAADYLAAGVPVGRHLADQLLLPMALGQGGLFRTLRPTGHTRTHVELLRTFLGTDIQMREADERAWEIEVPPRR